MDPHHEKEQNFLTEILKASLIALVIVIPIRFFVAQPYIVSGASMDPTFEDGHYIIVDQLTYRFEEPRRGDVVVFRYPLDTSKFFIKRILGLPGETIVLDEGKLIIASSPTSTSGYILEEPYVTADHRTGETQRRVLEEGEYFVMGDNRRASSDSRVWGPLQEELIVGKAAVRILPVTQIGTLPGKFTFTDLTFEMD
jgi:signal peptidase I